MIAPIAIYQCAYVINAQIHAHAPHTCSMERMNHSKTNMMRCLMCTSAIDKCYRVIVSMAFFESENEFFQEFIPIEDYVDYSVPVRERVHYSVHSDSHGLK